MIADPDIFDRFDLNASLSSPIFGKSTKVQPKAYQTLIIIKT